MSMSDFLENALHKLILTGVAIANIADNAASAPAGNLYFSLHTADPGEGGDQTASEVTYTSYARVPLARVPASWNIVAAVAKLAAVLSFPAGTGGSGTASFFAIGTDAAGAGRVLYSGPLSPTVNTGNGVTPQLGTNTSVTLD